MAADVEANIVIKSGGGDAAAADIKKATDALNTVTTSSSHLESQFQHRFQHIGLQLFAGDALRASGLGMEARQVITTLNMALTEGAAAAGLSSGGFMLLVAALTAVIGLVATAIEKHKSEADALEKLREAQTKTYNGYIDDITAMQKFADAGGDVTEEMKNLLAADQAVADDMKTNLLVTQEKEIAALEKQRDSVVAMAGVQQAWGEVANATSQQFKNLYAQLIAINEPITRMTSGIKNWVASLVGGNSAAAQNVQLTGAAKDKYDALTAAIAKLKFEHAQTTSGMTSDLKALADAEQKHKEQVEKSVKDEMDFRDKQYKKLTEAQQKRLDKEVEIAKRAVDQIGGDFGNAIGKMVVEGESFSESMKHAFKSMAEQIISDIARMLAEWLLFEALTGMGGGAAAAGARIFPQFSGHASGGSAMVDSPTLFLAGEAGPEVASFTPLSATGGGSSGGGSDGGITIGHITNNVYGVTNPDAIAAQIGQKIIQQIRGAGQLSFVRP